jgi:hypothetical protein
MEYAAWVHDQFFGSNPYIPHAVKEAEEKAMAETQEQPKN